MSGWLAEIERLVAQADDADDVLRGVVRELARDPDISWAGIRFLDDGALVPGPEEGTANPDRRHAIEVTYQGAPVGELAVDGDVDRALLVRVGGLVSTHVLLGWDTGGHGWEP